MVSPPRPGSNELLSRVESGDDPEAGEPPTAAAFERLVATYGRVEASRRWMAMVGAFDAGAAT